MPTYKIYAEEERYAENEIPHRSLHLVATAELRNVGPDNVAKGFMNDFRDLVASWLEIDRTKLAMTLEKTETLDKWVRT